MRSAAVVERHTPPRTMLMSGYRCVPVIEGLLYNKASSMRLPLSMSPTAFRYDGNNIPD